MKRILIAAATLFALLPLLAMPAEEEPLPPVPIMFSESFQSP